MLLQNRNKHSHDWFEWNSIFSLSLPFAVKRKIPTTPSTRLFDILKKMTCVILLNARRKYVESEECPCLFTRQTTHFRLEERGQFRLNFRERTQLLVSSTANMKFWQSINYLQWTLTFALELCCDGVERMSKRGTSVNKNVIHDWRSLVILPRVIFFLTLFLSRRDREMKSWSVLLFVLKVCKSFRHERIQGSVSANDDDKDTRLREKRSTAIRKGYMRRTVQRQTSKKYKSNQNCKNKVSEMSRLFLHRKWKKVKLSQKEDLLEGVSRTWLPITLSMTLVQWKMSPIDLWDSLRLT